MSLIMTEFWKGGIVPVICSRCQQFCFWEKVEVLSDMALRGVKPLCWDCDGGQADRVPDHLLFMDDHYLVGMDDKCFLVSWLTDDVSQDQAFLRFNQIGASAYYALKTGDVRQLWSLSSSSNLNSETE